MRVTLKSILLAMASLVVLIFLSACTGKSEDAPKFPYPKAPLAISQPVQKAQAGQKALFGKQLFTRHE